MEQYFLPEALKKSPYQRAFRVGANDGVWEVQQQGATFTLIHIPILPPGFEPPGSNSRALPPEVYTFDDIEALFRVEARLNTWLNGWDWIPDTEATRKQFHLPPLPEREA